MMDTLPASGEPDQARAARLAWTGALAAVLAASAAPAFAQSPPVRQGLFDAPANDKAPPAQRFVTPDGGVRFVLDRSGRYALVRFEGEDEVHVLRPVAGPRGDEFYKNDAGDTLLRVTALGGVIVFRDAARMGAPAAAEGPVQPLPPPAAPVSALRARIDALTRETQRRLGRPVAFTAPAAEGPAAGVVLDAAARTADALAATRPMHVQRVLIEYRASPGAVLMPDGSLRVFVTPQLGYAGRPSAAAVQRVITTVEITQTPMAPPPR